LVRFTVDEGLKGLEMHLGLPGTVGGAVYMNSKWMHPEGYVGDAVYQAQLLAENNEIIDTPQSHFHFGYDYSILQKNGEILLGAVFALTPDNKDELWNIANSSIRYRRQTQPQGVKTAGCTFRNITKAQALIAGVPDQTTSAGFLLDHAGCKGLRVGDAQISTDHANFIINLGSATAGNMMELIRIAKDRVKRTFGVD
jgi:UDP-N-acetylenolpyruvoylglucosamine reductase